MNNSELEPFKISTSIKILFFIYLVLSFYLGVYYDAGLMQDGARYLVHYLNSGYFYVDTNTWRFGPILFQLPISFIRAILPPEIFIKFAYKLFLIAYFTYPLLGLFWSFKVLKLYNKTQYFTFALVAQLVALGAAEYFYFVAINQAFLFLFPCIFHFCFGEEKKATTYFFLLMFVLAFMHQSYILLTPVFLALIFLNKHSRKHKTIQLFCLFIFFLFQFYLSYIYISPTLNSSAGSTFDFVQWPFASNELPWSKRGISFLLSFAPICFYRILKGVKFKILFFLSTVLAIYILLSDTYYGLYILESRMLIAANLVAILSLFTWSLYRDQKLSYLLNSVLVFILIFKIIDIGFVGTNWIKRYDQIFSFYNEKVKPNTCYMYTCFHEDFGVWDNDFIRHMPVLKERSFTLNNFKPMIAAHLDDNSCQELAIRHPANLGHASDTKEGTFSTLHNLIKFDQSFVDRYQEFSNSIHIKDLLRSHNKILLVGRHELLLESISSLQLNLNSEPFQAIELWSSSEDEPEFETYSTIANKKMEIKASDSLSFNITPMGENDWVKIESNSALGQLYSNKVPKVFSFHNDSLQVHLINQEGYIRSWKKSGECVYEVTN